jgi:DNA mismatch repair protein MutL
MTAKGHIRLLPTTLSNQIAAGEVIERPASVIKELVENAIDAEATSIVVDLIDGGQRLIRVVDDGYGMSRHDASLCVQRHATSKLTSFEDLTNISTLGFRGEALPSIASVSRFSLTTLRQDDDVATRISIEGGSPTLIADESCPPGTRIEIRDLFFNVPARLKFLKQPSTEFAHIRRLLNSMALGYPYVRFRCSHNGKMALDYPQTTRWRDRIYQVFGKTITAGLHEVQYENTAIRVHGFVSEPDSHRANQSGIYTFINGRFIRDRVVTHALNSAYAGRLPSGRHPSVVLFIYVPHDMVDVNVHPTKAEVRFTHPGMVHQAIAQSVAGTLDATPWMLLPAEKSFGPERTHREPALSWNEPNSTGHQESHQPSGPSPPLDYATPTPQGACWSFVGLVRDRFALCHDAQGISIVDMRKFVCTSRTTTLQMGWEAGATASQDLMFPATIEAEASSHRHFEAHGNTLKRLGLTLEPFGGQTWQLISIPCCFSDTNPNLLLTSLGKMLQNLSAHATPAEVEKLILALADASLNAPFHIDPAETQALLRATGTDSLQLPEHMLISIPLEESADRS